MSLIQFYGVLATTASIFVGILTAYLVTRLSDLKSERSRIKQRVESINAEIRDLSTRYDFRIDQLESTHEQWRREEAEEDVDDFIESNVGTDWNPDSDSISVEEAVEALVEYQDVDEDELVEHHLDMLQDRWDEIIDELEPDPQQIAPTVSAEALAGSDPLTGANWVIETLWNIYEREKYDTHDTKAVNIRRELDRLEDEREVLAEEFESLDPKQLKDSIKAAIVPIVLSVVLPLFFRLLHETGLVLRNRPTLASVEPIAVSFAWIVGFFWTLRFVWVRVSDTEEDLPESPLDEQDLFGLSDDSSSNVTDIIDSDARESPAEE
jgi:hypothetical protein